MKLVKLCLMTIIPPSMAFSIIIGINHLQMISLSDSTQSLPLVRTTKDTSVKILINVITNVNLINRNINEIKKKEFRISGYIEANSVEGNETIILNDLSDIFFLLKENKEKIKVLEKDIKTADIGKSGGSIVFDDIVNKQKQKHKSSLRLRAKVRKNIMDANKYTIPKF
jgi:hypothetical protein